MKQLLYLIIYITVLASCTKEISFDYHETAPQVVIEGRVTNEGMSVVITRSRNVTDSAKGRCIEGALVLITSEGMLEQLWYDEATQCYRSPRAGIAGQTYQLSVDFEDGHYESTSQMFPPAPIQSVEFEWMSVMKERIMTFEMWAEDPQPDERNYYLYRMDRRSSHPHTEGLSKTEPYRWSVFDDRGCPPGLIFRDIICMSEKAVDEDKEEDWKDILYEGDVITFSLTAIDRSAYDFFTSLRAGQSNGANPRSNITGGCQGYFAAMNITVVDTIVYHRMP